MDTALIIELTLYTIGGLLYAVFFYFFAAAIATYCVYTATLVRGSKKKWARGTSAPEPERQQMDAEGLEWQAPHAEKKQDVHIVNAGLNLYGEYYDFGSDKCVIVLSGRTENLQYGYYFAKPYYECGFNVLVIDPRAHGLSDGKYNTIGFEEHKDALAWARYLHDEHGVQTIVFHGICIGSAGAMYAITSPECPDYIKGMAGEGMFINFGESMKRHLIEQEKDRFPVMQFLNAWMYLFTRHTMKTGPIDYIEKMSVDKKLLMLHSKKDQYSDYQNAQKLFALCPCTDKTFETFEEGGHSMLRYVAREKYDDAVRAFASKF